MNTNAEHVDAYNPNDAEFNKFNNEYIKSIAVVNVKKVKVKNLLIMKIS